MADDLTTFLYQRFHILTVAAVLALLISLAMTTEANWRATLAGLVLALIFGAEALRSYRRSRAAQD